MSANILHKVLVTKIQTDTEEIEVSAVTEQDAIDIALSVVEGASTAEIIDEWEEE